MKTRRARLPARPPLPPAPAVVATIHTRRGLTLARDLAPGAVDYLELRLDALAPHLRAVEAALPQFRHPIILTARAPEEGGAGNLPPAARIALLLRFLPWAALVDLELASLPALAAVAKAARHLRQGVILSVHDFDGVPSARRLAALAGRAARSGAALFKVAATPAGPADLAPLCQLLGRPAAVPVAAMAMGPLGKAARLLLARCGSALNYGYLDRPQVAGQWPAPLLKARLAEL